MKRSTLMKLALSLVAMFAFVGTYAQVANTNYTDITADAVKANYDYETFGKTFGLYAKPDVVYHPSYTAVGSWTLTTGFVWDWTTTLTFTKPGPANYILVDNTNAVGVYALNVKEHASAAYGGCADATGQNATVVIFPNPTFSFTAGDAVAITDASACGGLTAKAITINLTSETFGSAYIDAKWRLVEYPVTIDGSGNAVVGAARTTTNYEWNKFLTTPQTINTESWAMAQTSAFSDVTPVLAANTLTMSRNYTVNTGAGDRITLYRWIFDTAASEGINDRISRKSDFIGGTTSWYGGTTASIDIYVKVAPTTGPIYHISNSFAN